MRDTPFGFGLLIFTELRDLTPGEGPSKCMNLYVFELPCSVRIGEIWTEGQTRSKNHQRTKNSTLQYFPIRTIQES